MQLVLKHLTAINQGPNESMASYHWRFLAIAEVIEMQWGPFLPTKLEAANGTTKVCASMLSMIFLARADKERYGN
jgi:hypothetical protein